MKIKLGVIWAALLLAAGVAGAASKPEAGPQRIGHRGTRALVDENTMESFQRAAEIGVDMIEFDIQRTRDGVFVIMHDDTVDRTTDGKGRVDQMTLEEFKLLKTRSGYTPPTLDETLVWLAANSLGFILDFKVPDPNFARDLVKVIEDRNLIPRAVFESMLPEVAGEVEKIKPEAITAIYPENQLGMVFLADKYHIDQVSYNWHLATPGQVCLAKARHHQVLVWTVNSRGLIRWFSLLKVHGIMTDDPNLFQEKKKSK